MGLDDIATDRETEARTLSGGFRREERLEDLRVKLRRYSRPGITHGDRDTSPRSAGCGRPTADRDRASGGRRIQPIQYEVDQNLLQLTGVGEQLRQIGGTDTTMATPRRRAGWLRSGRMRSRTSARRVDDLELLGPTLSSSDR